MCMYVCVNGCDDGAMKCTVFDVLARVHVVIIALCIVIFNESAKKPFFYWWVLCQDVFWCVDFHSSRDTFFKAFVRIFASVTTVITTTVIIVIVITVTTVNTNGAVVNDNVRSCAAAAAAVGCALTFTCQLFF